MTAIAPPEAPPPPPPTPEDAAALAPPPQPAVDPAQVEAVVGAIGLRRFVMNQLRKFHLYQLEKAARVGDDVDRKIYQFLGRTEPEEARDLPEWDFEEVRAAVEHVPTPEQTTDIIAAFQETPDLGLAAVQVAERIQGYLRSKAPHRVHMTVAGPIQEMPGHSDVARFRRLWNLACDPLGILDDLNEFAVSRDMVQGLRDMYPLLWARIDQGVDQQLMRKMSQDPKYRLSVRKDALLRVLTQREDASSKVLGTALQAIHAQAAQAMAAKQAPAPKKGGKGAVSEASAADRIGT